MSEIIKKCYYDENNNINTLKVMIDDNPFNPREFDCNLSHLYIEWGRRKDKYGDDFDNKSLSNIIEDYASKYTSLNEEDIFYNKSDRELILELQKSKDLYVLPVYGYEHSGFSISLNNSYPFNDRWDGGLAGFIFLERKDIENVDLEFTKKEIYNIAELEVKTYNQYLNNEVYGYIIENEEGEEIDVCFGIYSDKYGEELIKEIANEFIGKDITFIGDYNNNKFLDDIERD